MDAPSPVPPAPAVPAALPGEHAERLRAALHGDLLIPGDDGWDAARQAWQVRVDQRPAAVVVAADADDVVTTVRAARELGLRVAPQSTGHAAGTIPSLAGTILLRTWRLDEVTIDAAAGTARVGAGALWGDVAARAAEHGLAAVAGMSSTVGVAGLLLGGGLGWLARSHGLGASSLVSIDVVDALGRTLTVDAEHHGDLFWAAHGGSAPVVVTAVQIRLHPVAQLSAGALMWPVDRAADVAHAWREWSAGLPDTVTSLVRVLRYPPIPDIPEALRGRSFVAVEAAVQADPSSAAALLQPLRALGPALDSVRPMSPAELGTVHGDPPRPSPAYGAAVVLAEITPESVDALLGAALSAPAAPLLSIELRQLGGALTPGRADGGAVAAVDGAGLVYAVGIVPVPEALEPVRAAAAAVTGALRPYASGTVVKNFAETPAPASTLYGDQVDRLRRVVTAWDPDRMISTGHPID
ncbi:FAD-dependent oxidoreductase [Georgenia sp. TF02-10]|uniref:FAD-binding oxidoreductase n=1 Tax=Georgenia sp. TF02-10 TaxID=2917725 RepID=UPI001FA797CA|nr:FAD-binding protein [Georgenia sp. TF02-10]UNX54136.1 FAD-dependent oxidoreductase [Georgenia sp. TF02-10]